MEEMNFKIGDYIIYGSSGICLIEDIRPFSFSLTDEPSEHYVLKPQNSKNSVLYVPTDNELLKKKMRAVLTKEEIDGILLNVRHEELEWVEDRKQRSADFKEIIASGNQKRLILLIRCIYLRDKVVRENGKKLSASDSDVLSTAERMVREEFAFALDIPTSGVDRYIRSVLG